MDPRIASVLPHAVLVLALIGVSFGSIFVRLAAAPALAVALWRMTFASAAVVPVAALASRPRGPARPVAVAAAAGGLLALHFATWISSLDYTTVARSVLLVNTAPVFVAVIAALFLGERLSPGAWAGVDLISAGAIRVALN